MLHSKNSTHSNSIKNQIGVTIKGLHIGEP